MIDAPVEIDESARCRPAAAGAGRITFEQVDFAYKPEPPVLRGVTFASRPGERIGITGETGAGKSTLLSLVMRFYDATAGRVTIDGHDLRAARP